MTEKYHLTPVEFELMTILWKIGQGTVRDVMAHLPANRNLAYTSVSTILRILQQKKILLAEKAGRNHIYLPILSKEDFASHSVNKIINQVFSGNSLDLVTYLMDAMNLTLHEISSIQEVLNSRKKELEK